MAYTLINKKEDIATKIKFLHREVKLSLCIIDQQNDENTIFALNSFIEEKDINIYIAISDNKLRVKKLIEKLPFVNFLVFSGTFKYGDIVNAVSKECYSTYFLVLNSNVIIDSINLENIMLKMEQDKNILAIAPRLYNRLNEPTPIISIPAIIKKELNIINFIADDRKEITTLYPFYGIAIFNRALFQRLREIDNNINSSYWQLVDMGLTCYLLGYYIISSESFKAHYINSNLFIEDRSICKGIDRLYTKALCVRQKKGKNKIKKWGLYSNSKYLKEVEKRILLYKTDIFNLIKDWENIY